MLQHVHSRSQKCCVVTVHSSFRFISESWSLCLTNEAPGRPVFQKPIIQTQCIHTLACLLTINSRFSQEDKCQQATRCAAPPFFTSAFWIICFFTSIDPQLLARMFFFSLLFWPCARVCIHHLEQWSVNESTPGVPPCSCRRRVFLVTRVEAAFMFHAGGGGCCSLFCFSVQQSVILISRFCDGQFAQSKHDLVKCWVGGVNSFNWIDLWSWVKPLSCFVLLLFYFSFT